MRKTKRLLDEYRFPGFRPIAKIMGKFGDSRARIIHLKRQKKQYAVVEKTTGVIMIVKHVLFAICRAAQCAFIWKWRYAELNANDAER